MKSIKWTRWCVTLSLTLGVLLLPEAGQAQTVEWAESAGGSGGLFDQARGIAVDAAGNSYVTGIFEGTANFAPLPSITSAGSTDIYVAKYDTDGNVLWVEQAGGISGDQGLGIAVDTAGNTYLTGAFIGTATFGPFTLNSAGWPTNPLDMDVFVAKYDPNGIILWVRRAGGVLDQQGNAIAVDAANNCYLTGRFRGGAAFGPFNIFSANSAVFDIFVAKYDTNGAALWARSAGGSSGQKQGNAIAVDAAGSSYVTGEFQGGVFFGLPPSLASAGGDDIFVARYDTNGNVLWAQQAGGASGDQGRGIGVDAAGNSYVTGAFTGPVTFGTVPVTNAGNFDMFVAQYDSSGNVLWAQSAGGPGVDAGLGIAVEGSGNSYVTGVFRGTADFGPTSIFSAGVGDVFVAKYDAGGNALWAQSAGGTVADAGEGIGVDAASNSYVTGSFTTAATFGAFTLTSAGGIDIFVAKFGVDCPPGALCRPSTGPCDPDEFCNAAGVCPPDILLAVGTPCWNQSSSDCDNPDTCNAAGVCDTNIEPNGTPCNTGNPCTPNDTCDAGVCLPGPTLVCPNISDCLNEFCDPVAGCVFTFEPLGTPCATAFPCLDGQCDGVSSACGIQPVDCNDSDPCTIDHCDDGAGGCVSQPIGALTPGGGSGWTCVGGAPNPDQWCRDRIGAPNVTCDLVNDVCVIAGCTPQPSDFCANQGAPDAVCELGVCVCPASNCTALTPSQWQGPNSGDFMDPVNWNPNGVPIDRPAELDNTSATDNTAVLNAGDSVMVCNLKVKGTVPPTLQTLLIKGTLTTTEDGNAVQPGGVVKITATGELRPAKGITNNGGTLSPLTPGIDLQGGTITLGSGEKITNARSGEVLHNVGDAPPIPFTGASLIVLGGPLEITGNVTNDGVIQVSTGLTLTIIGSFTNNNTAMGNIVCIPPNPPLCLTGGGSSGTLDVTEDITMGPDATVAMPGGRIRVMGDFDVAINDSQRFDLATAELNLDGIFLFGDQELELLSPNLGAVQGAPFAIGTLRIGPNEALTVTLVGVQRGYLQQRAQVDAFRHGRSARGVHTRHILQSGRRADGADVLRRRQRLRHDQHRRRRRARGVRPGRLLQSGGRIARPDVFCRRQRVLLRRIAGGTRGAECCW